MSGKVIYKDIALGADETALIQTPTALEPFSSVGWLTLAPNAPAIATCELNGWGLSHEYKNRTSQTLAFWSVERSGADCLFASAPSVVLTFPAQYTSTGLTVRFATASNDFCRRVHIEWWRGTTRLHSEDYENNSSVFVVNRTVEAYDKLVFSFNETNLPGKRCKVEKIIIGVIREFEADELTRVNAIHEVNLIGDTVPINVLDVGLHSKSDIEYIFQRKQPVEAYDNDTLIGTYYIQQGRRTSRDDFSISCQDVVGLLDLITYEGGIWLEDTPLNTVLSQVFGNLVKWDIDPALAGATIRGAIEPGRTMREALMHIAFAIGAVIDTSGTDRIKIFPVPSDAGAIAPRNTYTGGSVETSDKVTEVTVTAYRFFDERPGQNDEFIDIGGVQYRYYTETKHAYNPNVVASDPENKVKFIGYYLCNLDNAQKRADEIMAFYHRRNKYVFNHVYSGEELGGKYEIYLPWLHKRAGNITKMSITLSGLTISAAEMLFED